MRPVAFEDLGFRVLGLGLGFGVFRAVGILLVVWCRC